MVLGWSLLLIDGREGGVGERGGGVGAVGGGMGSAAALVPLVDGRVPYGSTAHSRSR